MELFIFVVSLVMVSSKSLDTNYEKYAEHWQNFKDKNEKEYRTASDELYRKNIFIDNVIKIERHNELYKRGDTTFKMNINHLADMTGKEFLAYVIPQDVETIGVKSSYKIRTRRSPNRAELPESIDLRTMGLVGKVEDQENCRASWSFSATGALEGQYAKYSKEFLPLSQQNLIDCSIHKPLDGCNVGDSLGGLLYTVVDGIESAADYAYERKSGRCRYNRTKAVVRPQYVTQIKPGDENSLKAAIAHGGPAAVGMNIQEDLQFYSSGVYDNSACDGSVLNHGALVVGYGEENNEEYWLIKNSWGTHWGQEGYLKLKRNHNNLCGIANKAYIPIL